MLKSSAGKRLLIILAVSLTAILCAIGFRYYQNGAPAREERKLRDSSFTQLIAIAKAEPDNARVFYYLGKHFQNENKAEAASKVYQVALKLDPNDEDIVLAAADASVAMRNDQEAFDTLHTYVGNHPKSGKAHLALAVLYNTNKGDLAAYQEATTAAQLIPNDPKAWRMLGTASLFATRESEAEPAFRHALQLDPNDWRSELGLANTLHILKRDPESVPHYKKAMALAPPDDQLGIVLPLGRAQIGAAADAASVEEAAETLRRAVAIDPSAPLGQMAFAEALMRQEHWAEAKDPLLFAEKKLPDNPEVHNDLLHVYQHLHDQANVDREDRLTQSTMTYKHFIEDTTSRSDQPGHQFADRLTLARAYRDHGDFPNAMKWYGKVLEFAPENKMVQQEYAAFEQKHPELMPQAAPAPPSAASSQIATIMHDADDLLEQKKFVEAEASYRSALAIDANSGIALQGLGLALYGQGRLGEAFSAATRAAGIDSTLPEAQFTIAQIYYRSGFQDEAARRLTLLVNAYPNDPKYVHALGACLSMNSLRFPEAENSLKRAVELDPENPMFLADLASLQAKVHHDTDADGNFRQAARLDPDNIDVTTRFAEFLADHNPNPEDAAQAEQYLRKALAATPSDSTALLSVGRLSALRNDHASAISSLEAAVKIDPSLSAAWYELSREYLKTGNTARAAECQKRFARASEANNAVDIAEEQARLHMKDPKVLLMLARTYAKYDVPAKAINEYEYCLYLDKTNTSIKKELAGYEATLKARNEMPDMSVFNAMVNEALHAKHP